ncbi:ferredoxin [Streptomyces sp. NPDC015171]|uniref:ferredoxin n=1 Tax=Streptomyces sp. NPDC015171 TaxID=3364945 RepID=UPI0037007870
MTSSTSQDQLYRFLEDRFSCALACTECARACAVRASLIDPGGAECQERARRLGLMCAEACDATRRVLSEEDAQIESGVRVRVAWCRSVCLECAAAFDEDPDAESVAALCRACAEACGDFLQLLT